MNVHDRYDLTTVINARGTFTPLGVSRSSDGVCSAIAEALADFFIVDELQALADRSIANFAGAEAATVTHCVASAITISVAATMAGTSNQRIAALPDTAGLANSVVIPAGHCVNYGQSILQAIRLSGAAAIVAGNPESCELADIERQIEENHCCCLLLVSSKLVESAPIDFSAAVEVAHKHGIPAIIDGAAQDFRIDELIQTNADLVLVSAQKYLGAPTAGLVIGRRGLVDAVSAQDKGIGRGMKATKESIVGVLAAIEERQSLDISMWRETQHRKVVDFMSRANAIDGIGARSEPDPTGLPFSRVYLQLERDHAGYDLTTLVGKLKSGQPSIWVVDQNITRDEIGLELVQVSDGEISVILERLAELLGADKDAVD